MPDMKLQMSSVEFSNPMPGMRYLHQFGVDGEPGLQFFTMLFEFLHKCPPWVKEEILKAVEADRIHDRENCPHCNPTLK